MAKNKKIGQIGEELAANFLIEKGYEILEKNWRYSNAEIDIIAKDRDILVFIEVKTRSSDYYGAPEEFVSARQSELIFKAAQSYTEQIAYDWAIRFDIISLLKDNTRMAFSIKHIEDVYH